MLGTGVDQVYSLNRNIVYAVLNVEFLCGQAVFDAYALRIEIFNRFFLLISSNSSNVSGRGAFWLTKLDLKSFYQRSIGEFSQG